MDASVLELLKGVELFSELSDDQLRLLGDLVEVQNFNRDETVVLEGDDSVQALYLIASGSVQVYMTGVDGRETILSFLERGDFFGEMSLIDGEPRSASVRTVSDSQLMIIYRDAFLSLIKQYPELAMSLLSEMSKRLRKANKQIGSLSTMSVSGRVAGTLLNLMEERGVRIHTDNGKMVTVIHNRPTQQQLADAVHVTRAAISHWETGRTIPDYDVIQELEQILGYSFAKPEEQDGKAEASETADAETPGPQPPEAVRPRHRIPRWAYIVIGCLLAGEDSDDIENVDIEAVRSALAELKGQLLGFWASNDEQLIPWYAGDFWAGEIWSGPYTELLASDKTNIKLVHPEEGTVGYIDYWSVVEGTDEYDLACEWINWIESEEVQYTMATGESETYPGEYLTYTPVNATVIENLTPDQKIALELDPMPTSIKLLPYIADPDLKDQWTDLYQEFVG